MSRMRESITKKTYDAWAVIYDRTFGALVHRRQLRALDHVRPREGDRVLDLGVGTGMTLRHYPRNVTVVGLDLSPGMLAKAADKKRDLDLAHCHLVNADAMLPPFADASFDHIVISHTISVVSEPARLLAWAARLVKPTGRIVVLNHFLSASPFLAWWEKVFNPLCVKIGWRSDLSLEECMGDCDLHVAYRFKISLFDFWQIAILTPHQPGVTRGAEASTATAADPAPHGKVAIAG